MTIQAPWDAADLTQLRASIQAPVAKRVPTLPAIEPDMPTVAPQGASGMIFLRHNETGWHARFFGVPGVGGKNEIPLPCPIDATLVQVIERLQGRFPACWLLVSP